MACRYCNIRYTRTHTHTPDLAACECVLGLVAPATPDLCSARWDQWLYFWSAALAAATSLTHPPSLLSLSPPQIAREHGIRFFETSAKANINIEKAFLTLAEDILKKVSAPGWRWRRLREWWVLICLPAAPTLLLRRLSSRQKYKCSGGKRLLDTMYRAVYVGAVPTFLIASPLATTQPSWWGLFSVQLDTRFQHLNST